MQINPQKNIGVKGFFLSLHFYIEQIPHDAQSASFYLLVNYYGPTYGIGSSPPPIGDSPAISSLNQYMFIISQSNGKND